MDLLKRAAELESLTKEDLVAHIINQELNDFIRDRDHDGGEMKAVPYFGWWWREIDFVGNYMVIAEAHDQIAFCMNNKWGYPQRRLTDEECEQVTKFICEAHSISQQGGILADISANTDAKLQELSDWLQTLKVVHDDEEVWDIMGSLQGGSVASASSEADALRTALALQEAGGGISNYTVKKRIKT